MKQKAEGDQIWDDISYTFIQYVRNNRKMTHQKYLHKTQNVTSNDYFYITGDLCTV